MQLLLLATELKMNYITTPFFKGCNLKKKSLLQQYKSFQSQKENDKKYVVLKILLKEAKDWKQSKLLIIGKIFCYELTHRVKIRIIEFFKNIPISVPEFEVQNLHLVSNSCIIINY